MNVLHITTKSSGGAGICVQRLSHSLMAEGINCLMLNCEGEVTEGATMYEPDVDPWYRTRLTGRMKHLLMRAGVIDDAEVWDERLQRAKQQLQSVPYLSHHRSRYTAIVRHPLVDWADVIHLHWVSRFIDYPTFFRQIKKPVVWTLHDMNPILGLMHYESELQVLPEALHSLDMQCRSSKAEAISKASTLHPVAISHMMQNEIERSAAMQHLPCSLIYNGIDMQTFCTADISCREKEETVFLFSSVDIWDERKQLTAVIAAIEQCAAQRKHLIVIGDTRGRMPSSDSVRITCTGSIHDDTELAKLYQTADVFIMASTMESFSQTVIEALACGTPVVATPTGIAPEVVNDATGCLCQGFTTSHIAQSINRVLEKKYDAQSIRESVVRRFSYSNISAQYKALYLSLLEHTS